MKKNIINQFDNADFQRQSFNATQEILHVSDYQNRVVRSYNRLLEKQTLVEWC